MITTYTGLPQHRVFVGVLSVPTDESVWSPRLRVYLKAISGFHARKKETPLGILMVTNLSGFPSALTVITVPGGDVKSQRENFMVNENMKRLGCSGRAGLTLLPPTGATKAKFTQSYHTSSRVLLPRAVIELVRLCQVALVLFAKLAPEYADGLLCDVTERAITDWWTEVGIEYFNVEPGDGILGPTTVAALLGMLLGARNRLHAYGAPVAKDVFDLRATKRAIAYFQKALKIDRTRRLDRQTLERLHRATSKAASGDGWTVPKAVKSTVVELSGKSGEMMMGMVGGRDKVGIAEVETLDIETFIRFVSGESCKWLWYGKARKHNSGDLFGNLPLEDEMVFNGDENGGYIWASRKRDSVTEGTLVHNNQLDHLYMQPNQISQASFDQSEKDQATRKTVFKSVTGKMSDAKSGLGRIKDAVGITGLRGHQHKTSKDGDLTPDISNRWHTISSNRNPNDTLSLPSSPQFNVKPTRKTLPSVQQKLEPESDGSFSEDGHDLSDDRNGRVMGQSRTIMSSIEDSVKGFEDSPVFQNSCRISDEAAKVLEKEIDSPYLEKQGPIESQAYGESHKLPFQSSTSGASSIARRRFTTSGLSKSYEEQSGWDFRWSRHLSSSMLDKIREASRYVQPQSSPAQSDPQTSLATENYLALGVSCMADEVRHMAEHDARWMKQTVCEIGKLGTKISSEQRELDAVHYQQLEEYKRLSDATRDLISERKKALDQSLKEIEVLGAKLEYEMSALQSKIVDVDDGVMEFERQVQEIEIRAAELEDEKSSSRPWFGWLRVSLGWRIQ